MITLGELELSDSVWWINKATKEIAVLCYESTFNGLSSTYRDKLLSERRKLKLSVLNCTDCSVLVSDKGYLSIFEDVRRFRGY